jgi:hypothetical protein
MLFNSSSKKMSKPIAELRRLITYSKNKLREPIDRLRRFITYSRNKLRGPIEEAKIYCVQANRKWSVSSSSSRGFVSRRNVLKRHCRSIIIQHPRNSIMMMKKEEELRRRMITLSVKKKMKNILTRWFLSLMLVGHTQNLLSNILLVLLM